MIRGKDHDHDHDLGLQHDLGALFNRRRALGLFASVSAIGGLSALGKGSIFSIARAEAIAKASDRRKCVLEPTETEGPFPGDGSNKAHGRLANVLERSGIVRREMRANVGNTAIATQGQALDLEITLEKAGRGCKPLAGHAIYIWQCDALGRYSIYDLPNASYLRAVGVTDTAGKAVFATIFPGCYRGRYPHIHFEVYMSLERATSYKNRLLTSQMAMPVDACRTIYAASKRYGASAANFTSVSVERDDVFADSTPRQIAAQTPMVTDGASGAYKGVLTIGISA
jgi:protocatechuate 3,4-dioxygenase beta subunit